MVSKQLSFASFNVRGLSEKVKKLSLSNDLKNYKVDICCLQETKIINGCDINIGEYRLIYV